jgi:hypothetical protein
MSPLFIENRKAGLLVSDNVLLFIANMNAGLLFSDNGCSFQKCPASPLANMNLGMLSTKV